MGEWGQPYKTAIIGNVPWNRVETANTLWTFNGATAGDEPTVYPLGITLFYTAAQTGGGWPYTYCGIKTENHHPTGAGAFQTVSDNLGAGRKSRKYIAGTGWTAWKDV